MLHASEVFEHVLLDRFRTGFSGGQPRFQTVEFELDAIDFEVPYYLRWWFVGHGGSQSNGTITLNQTAQVGQWTSSNITNAAAGTSPTTGDYPIHPVAAINNRLDCLTLLLPPDKLRVGKNEVEFRYTNGYHGVLGHRVLITRQLPLHPALDQWKVEPDAMPAADLIPLDPKRLAPASAAAPAPAPAPAPASAPASGDAAAGAAAAPALVEKQVFEDWRQGFAGGAPNHLTAVEFEVSEADAAAGATAFELHWWFAGHGGTNSTGSITLNGSYEVGEWSPTDTKRLEPLSGGVARYGTFPLPPPDKTNDRNLCLTLALPRHALVVGRNRLQFCYLRGTHGAVGYRLLITCKVPPASTSAPASTAVDEKQSVALSAAAPSTGGEAAAAAGYEQELFEHWRQPFAGTMEELLNLEFEVEEPAVGTDYTVLWWLAVTCLAPYPALLLPSPLITCPSHVMSVWFGVGVCCMRWRRRRRRRARAAPTHTAQCK
jgi:hypothetical protein